MVFDRLHKHNIAGQRRHSFVPAAGTILPRPHLLPKLRRTPWARRTWIGIESHHGSEDFDYVLETCAGAFINIGNSDTNGPFRTGRFNANGKR